jgi:ribokinase
VRVKNIASARKAARKLLDLGIELVALEAGDAGDLLVTAHEERLFPRLKVNSVDATGAGDAFAAGLSVGLEEHLSLSQVGRLANATAALATTKVGAQEGLPTRGAVERLLRVHFRT